MTSSLEGLALLAAPQSLSAGIKGLEMMAAGLNSVVRAHELQLSPTLSATQTALPLFN